MKKLFNFKKKESDAKRLYNIYKTIDVSKKIDYIVESEYMRMIYEGEKAALSGQTSFIFDLHVDEKNEIYFNIIMSDFITKLTDNEFSYSRQLLKSRNRLNIYFSKTDVSK